MIEVEYKTVPMTAQRALICGSTLIADAVAKEMVTRQIPVVMTDYERSSLASIRIEETSIQNFGSQGPMSTADLISKTAHAIGEPTLLVNICCPAADRKRVSLLDYADDLMSICTSMAQRMSDSGTPGCIINQCMLPAIYAGTDLEDPMAILRGAITGVTRSIARRYGKQGIRCIGVQTGLIDLPECNGWISEKLKQVEVPIKRWGTANEVAKLIAFLALEGSYITGQTIILDGGLTAGVTGT